MGSKSDVPRRVVLGGALAGAALAAAWTDSVAAQDRTAAAAIAPGGTLRAAINYGNAVLAARAADGTLSGVSVDLARELARRLAVPLTLVPFDAAGNVSDAAGRDMWDVAFLAIDPQRAREIVFTPAYVVIEGTYVVRDGSPLHRADQVDQPGMRVAVARGSAYDLFLSRTLTRATLVRTGNTPEAAAAFRTQNLDVLAGVKQALQHVIASDPGTRMLDGRFMTINQAMALPKTHADGAAALRAFVEDVKTSGFVAAALARHDQDATVAPPA